MRWQRSSPTRSAPPQVDGEDDAHFVVDMFSIAADAP
jgi:hypothetical protein